MSYGISGEKLLRWTQHPGSSNCGKTILWCYRTPFLKSYQVFLLVRLYRRWILLVRLYRRWIYLWPPREPNDSVGPNHATLWVPHCRLMLKQCRVNLALHFSKRLKLCSNSKLWDGKKKMKPLRTTSFGSVIMGLRVFSGTWPYEAYTGKSYPL